jgi:hypothetical protein
MQNILKQRAIRVLERLWQRGAIAQRGGNGCWSSRHQQP